MRGLVSALRRSGEGGLSYTGVAAALALLVAVFTASQPEFATWGNFITILETNSVLLIVAIGLTFVLLVGGFDLSVGGMVALSGVMLAELLQAGLPVGLAILLVLGGGAALGLTLNGMLVAKAGLSFFVVTLGTASLFRGAALVQTEGASQGLYEQTFVRSLGAGRIVGIPWPVIIALGILVMALVALRYTGFGRMVYAVGGNDRAARLAGVRVGGVRIAAYGICAGLAALAGVMEAGRLASATPTVAPGIELTAGAAVLLGGTSFIGGTGGMLGTLLGALFLGVLANGLTIAGISSFWQGVVAGAVLIVAVGFDRFRQVAVARRLGEAGV